MRPKGKATLTGHRAGQLPWPAEGDTPSLAADSVAFILHSKKWWLTPIVVVLLLLGAVAGLSGSGVAPLIYTLF